MINYVGGKSRIGKWIKDYIPRDIETYVEAFGGMFWVFFNLDIDDKGNYDKKGNLSFNSRRFSKLKRVVYNDVNDHNVNLFHCIQNPDKLSKEVEKFPHQGYGREPLPIHEEQYNRFQQELFHQNNVIVPPDYEAAAKYVYVLTQVYSGAKPAINNFRSMKGRHRSKFITFKERLKNPQWIKYFDRITDVEHEDFEVVIEKYDSPTTYFYADPPYWETEDYYSNMDFDAKDHERFANAIKQIQGKFGISYYDFPKLSEWFPKDVYTWESKDFKKSSAANRPSPKRDEDVHVWESPDNHKVISKKILSSGTELLIMNYVDSRLKCKDLYDVEY